VAGAALDRFDRALERRESGDDDDRDAGLPVKDLRNDVEPRLRAEPQIEHDELETTALDGFERALRRAHAEHSGAIGFETQPERLANTRVVVDDEDRPLRRLDHAAIPSYCRGRARCHMRTLCGLRGSSRQNASNRSFDRMQIAWTCAEEH